MDRKLSWILSMLFLLAVIGFGCGGGGSSSGGSSSNTIVGTWTVVSATGQGNPSQIIFNSDGNGTFSGTASGNGTFTWSLSGNTITMKITGGNTMTGTFTWQDNNNVTWTETGVNNPGTMTLRRV